MTPEEHKAHNKRLHKAQHEELHRKLDELVADFITHTGKLPSRTNLFDLIKWSADQAKNPTEVEDG